MKTKKQIESYVKSRSKGSFVGTYERWGKTWIYFQDKETGHFTGVLERDKSSERAVRKYAGIEVKIRARFPNKRGKKSFSYKVYNRKQQKEVLFRMNKRNRTPEARKSFKDYVEPKGYKRDAIPQSGNKKKVDLLFDEIKYEDAIIEYFEGKS